MHDGFPGSAPAVDVTLEPGPEGNRPSLDLDRILGARESDVTADLPLFPPPQLDNEERAQPARRTRPFGAADDAPLITAPARPRAPLGVRRATAEIPRARPRTSRPVALHEEPLFETPPVAVIGQAFDLHKAVIAGRHMPATALSRIMAGLIDVSLVFAIDAVVVYFTLRLLGLTTAEVFELPLLPIAAFFLLLNGGYFVAFTTVGGQSIGKMAFGIKVVGQEDSPVPVGQAMLRTIAYVASALPFGAGFVSGIISADRLALHDRLAHTRVVRPS